ncbi:MAG TPA: hypothetical protein VGG64_05120, partial [Pirellulales bacterium]
YDQSFSLQRLAKSSARVCRQYELTIDKFDRLLGRPATLADLTEANISRWVRAATEFGVSPVEIRRRRDMLIAIKDHSTRQSAIPACFERESLQIVGTPMLLTDLVEVYLERRNRERPIGREVSIKSSDHLNDSVQAFSKWLGRRATLDDLSADTVNQFLLDNLTAGKSPYTVKARRTGLLVLLRRAIRLGLVQDVDVRDVRTVHCPALRIDGYSQNDLTRLVEQAAKMKGVVRKTGISKSIFFASAILTQWNLGIRIGDLTRIAVRDFDPRGFFWVMESKTGKGRSRILQSATRGAIAACIAVNPHRQLIWPGLVARSLYRAVSTIAKDAGLPGTSRWIRRGAASLVENQKAGSAWKFLNHSVPTLFENHYRVERLVDPNPIAPPEVAFPEALADHPQPPIAIIDPVEQERRWELNRVATKRCRDRKKAEKGGAA